jgi:hypothetical protein
MFRAAAIGDSWHRQVLAVLRISNPELFEGEAPE